MTIASKTIIKDQADDRAILVFDAVLRINKSLRNKTPKHPVGLGEEIIDNVVNGNTTITVEGIVSDAHPRVSYGVKETEQDNILITTIKNIGVISQFSDALDRNLSRSSTEVSSRRTPTLSKTNEEMISDGGTKISAAVIESRLRGAANSKRIFKVEEGDNVFEDLVFKSLTIKRDNTSHRVLRFTAVFDQVRFVSFSTKAVSVVPSPQVRAETETPSGKTGGSKESSGGVTAKLLDSIKGVTKKVTEGVSSVVN